MRLLIVLIKLVWELRGFAKPPGGVEVCMKAVLMMMENE